MSSSDQIREEALSLARQGLDAGEGAARLLARSPRRIPVVVAKQQLQEEVGRGTDPSAAQALQILEDMLRRGTWSD
jgi:hypothetical protein